MSSGELSPLAAAERMLAEMSTTHDVLNVIDLAVAARDWAAAARLGTSSINHATAIKVRAEIRGADVVDRGQAEGQIAKPGGDQSKPRDARVATFQELGLNDGRVSEWRLLRDAFTEAQIAEKQAKADTADKVLSHGALLFEARRNSNKTTAQHLAEHGLELPGGQYATVELDPPWSYPDVGLTTDYVRRSADRQYPVMDTQKIGALPVPDIAAENSHLYLWATFNHLRNAWEIAEGWGFTVRNLLVWDKQRIGLGNYFRNSAEYVLFGTRGHLPLLRHDMPTVYRWPPQGRVHSRKPDAFYDLIETCSPGPRVRLFARSQRDGWTSWGNETEGADTA